MRACPTTWAGHVFSRDLPVSSRPSSLRGKAGQIEVGSEEEITETQVPGGKRSRARAQAFWVGKAKRELPPERRNSEKARETGLRHG